jgi:hypothetical protein
MTTGRNFDEALHVVDRYNSPPSIASQRPRTGSKAKTSSSSGAVTDEAKRLYPGGWKALKPYMRRAATAVASPLSLCFDCESAASAALFVLEPVEMPGDFDAGAVSRASLNLQPEGPHGAPREGCTF